MPGRECQVDPVFLGPKERNVFHEDSFRSAGPCGAYPGPKESLSTPWLPCCAGCHQALKQLSCDLAWLGGCHPLVVGVFLSRGVLRPLVVAIAVVSGVRRDECRVA